MLRSRLKINFSKKSSIENQFNYKKQMNFCVKLLPQTRYFSNINVRLLRSKKICVFCFIDRPSKMMKNAFYFILKVLLFSRYFVFVTTFLSCRRNSLIRKIRLTSKLLTSQPGLQTIPIHILPNTSQSKGNQTMKLDQLIEHTKTMFFFKNYSENEAG